MATSFQLKNAQASGDTFTDASASDMLMCLNNGPANRAVLAGFTSSVTGAPAGSSKLRLTSSAMSIATNFGIGTTTPQSALDVVGAVNVSSNLSVLGSLAIGSNLTVAGGLTVLGTIVSAGQSVTGSGSGGSITGYVGSNVVINGGLTVLGAVLAGSFLMDATISNSNIIPFVSSNIATIHVASNITFGSNNVSLGVSSTGSNVIFTGGDLLLTSNLFVGGNHTTTGTSFVGTLSNLGGVSAGGALAATGSLTVGGFLSNVGNVFSTGASNVGGVSYTATHFNSGAATVGGALAAGSLIVAGVLSNAGNVYGTGASNVGGVTYMTSLSNAGTASVGSLVVGGVLSSGGGFSAGGAISAGGALTANGSLTVGGFLSNVGNVYSTGASNVGGVSYTATHSNAGGMSVGGALFAASLTVAGTVVGGGGGGGSLAAFRNRVINGDMRIDQRNNGALVTAPSGQSSLYYLDRWMVTTSASDCTIQQVSTSPSSFSKSLCITKTNTGLIYVQHWVPSSLLVDFNMGSAASGVALVVSMWIMSSTVGTVAVSLNNNNAASPAQFVTHFVIASAATWQYVTIAVPACSIGTWSNASDATLLLTISLGTDVNAIPVVGSWTNGSFVFATSQSISQQLSNTSVVNITGVQLEPGTTSTAFDLRPMDVAIQQCSRYYQKSYDYVNQPGTASVRDKLIFNCYTADPLTPNNALIRLSTPMRVQGMCTVYSPVTGSANAIAIASASSGVVSLTDVSTGLNVSSSTNSIGLSYAGVLPAAPASCLMWAHYAISAELGTPPLLVWSVTVPSLTTNIFSFDLSSVFSGATAYSVSGPYANTSFVGNVVSIQGASRGTTYIIALTAQNAFGSNVFNMNVTEATDFTFTNMTGVGSSGPSSVSYGSSTPGYTAFASPVTVNGGIQLWTVKTTGNYTLTVAGAGINNCYGIVGITTVHLNANDQIQILVGQQGAVFINYAMAKWAGCGGTFVKNITSNVVLVVAGGAGGGAGNSASSGINGVDAVVGGAGGVNTAGGAANYQGYGGQGGAGLSGDGGVNNANATAGNTSTPARSFNNGGTGGYGGDNGMNSFNPGGFGGGGDSGRADGRGGGGGYSGGGGANTFQGNHGGGGGSFTSTSWIAVNALNAGMGYVSFKFNG